LWIGKEDGFSVASTNYTVIQLGPLLRGSAIRLVGAGEEQMLVVHKVINTS